MTGVIFALLCNSIVGCLLGRFRISFKHLFCVLWRNMRFEAAAVYHTGEAYVKIGLMIALYRRILFSVLKMVFLPSRGFSAAIPFVALFLAVMVCFL